MITVDITKKRILYWWQRRSHLKFCCYV